MHSLPCCVRDAYLRVSHTPKSVLTSGVKNTEAILTSSDVNLNNVFVAVSMDVVSVSHLGPRASRPRGSVSVYEASSRHIHVLLGVVFWQCDRPGWRIG